MNKGKSPLILSVAAILLIAIFVQFYSRASVQRLIRHNTLLQSLPMRAAGYAIRDIPISSSDEMKKAVGEMLNYSDAVFREYRGAEKSISVYAAYWEPKKFNPRLIADHTPDICWVSNGWMMEKADYNYSVPLRGSSLLPAQYRELSANGITTYVLYWHVVDGKLSGYASGPSSRSNSFIANFMTDIKAGSGEQFFIRISSQNPWADWSSDALFNEILTTFSPVISAR